MFASACQPMRSTPAQHPQHGACCCRILKLAVVAIIYLASAAAGLTGTKSSAADGQPSSLNFHEGSTGGQQRALLNAQSRPAAVVRRSDGTLRLAEAPEGQKRPFKMAFYYDFDPAESPDVVEYIQETLVPAAASLLGRWIRVRLSSLKSVYKRIHNSHVEHNIKAQAGVGTVLVCCKKNRTKEDYQAGRKLCARVLGRDVVLAQACLHH